jgi:hypothetical protein
MTAITDLYVAGYVQGPYEQVCQLIEMWEGEPLWATATSSPGHVLGRLVRVSRAVARVPIERRGTVPLEKLGELRILPVITGHDSLNEVLLITEDSGEPSMTRSARVIAARSVLDSLLAKLDNALLISLAS